MANTRKNSASRKNRKLNEGANVPAEMPTMRKQEGGKRKGKSTKKRTLSPALKAWNEKVMKKYREMKKNDPNTRLVDAMRAAKRDS